MIEPRYSVEQGMRILMDTFKYGFSSPGTKAWLPSNGTVEDSKGVTTRLEDLQVDGRSCLPGRRGEADVEVGFSKLVSVEIRHGESGEVAVVNMKEGRFLEIELDGGKVLSGNAAFGSFQIPLKKVANIMFEST